MKRKYTQSDADTEPRLVNMASKNTHLGLCQGFTKHYWGGLGFKETKYKSVASAQPTTDIIQLAPENQLQIGEFPWAKDFAFGRLKVFRKPFFIVLENILAMNPQINISTTTRKSAHLIIYSFSDSEIT